MKDGRFQPRATGFFVDWIEDEISLTHVVTAEHVIAGLVRTKNDIFVRVNLVDDGVAEFRIDATEFRFHPDNAQEAADVAVMPFRANSLRYDNGNVVEIDPVSIALNRKEGGLLPQEDFKKRHMGVVGRYRSSACFAVILAKIEMCQLSVSGASQCCPTSLCSPAPGLLKPT
jgi:hypothetical protein